MVDSGNDLCMDVEDSTRALWADAAVSVQADQDADVRAEAQGLVIAEMADVAFVERIVALGIESEIKVAIRGQGWRRGTVQGRGGDFLVLGDVRDVLHPLEAIVAVESLPRVLHQEQSPTPVAQRSRTRRSLMGDLLGRMLHVSTHDFEVTGLLSWVGADHISLAPSGASQREARVTMPWTHIVGIALPPQWRQVS